MAKDWMMVMRYMFAAEESRIGRRNDWNRGFLGGKTSFNRVCLGLSKVGFLLILSTGIVLALAML